jgi:polyhydroxybutyrate depolymerase
VAVVVTLAALGLAACAQLSDDAVDLGVPGVEARWLRLPGIPARSVLVAAPTGVGPVDQGPPSGPPRPLVVAVHGFRSSAEQMATQSGWAAEAATRGFVVAFAQGRDASFNAGPSCCGRSAERNVDDVGYLRDVISDVPDFYPIDTERVYLTGYSNGGMLTYRFLCADADLLAGAASVAGTNAAGCEPAAPVPFLQVSGSDDTVVPLDGGRSSVDGIGPFPSVRASVEGLAVAMGCGPPRTETAGRVEATRWAPCRDGAVVGLDVVRGATHGYPADPGAAATPRIADFWGL